MLNKTNTAGTLAWRTLAGVFGLLLMLVGLTDLSLAQDSHTLVTANVRQGPGLDHPVLAVLSANTPIEVVDRNADGSWLRMSNGAWIYAQLVSNAPADLPEVAVAPGVNPPNTTPPPTAPIPAPSPELPAQPQPAPPVPGGWRS